MTTESLTGFHHENRLGSIMNRSEMIPLSGYKSTILPGNSSTTSPTLILPGNPSGSSHDSVAEFKHGTGLAVEWSADEQRILEDGLEKYKEEPNFMKYVKIAAILPDKAVRDVALRCWWMQRKRRRSEEPNAGKKVNNRKVNMPTTLPLNMAAFPFMMYHPDQIERMPSEGISGTILHLLKQNAQVFSQISSNLSSYKLQDNIDLFCYARNNITTILNNMRAMPGLMSQMSPLPISVDEDLVNSILPDASQLIFGTACGSIPSRSQGADRELGNC
ncbi:uncharacterized protein LOC120183287 isoform X2 [Hibiscus syriacus]|uniref:uncharacterized protein LOC120183287 isoform X2 n=1 Tax=Hibiscus syriacus TaxID=106335 RepID=UPI001920AD26|nr:uncharacterized protein LOC120183287 isoform X2 [Hibiscus syriacus]